MPWCGLCTGLGTVDTFDVRWFRIALLIFGRWLKKFCPLHHTVLLLCSSLYCFNNHLCQLQQLGREWENESATLTTHFMRVVFIELPSACINAKDRQSKKLWVYVMEDLKRIFSYFFVFFYVKYLWVVNVSRAVDSSQTALSLDREGFLMTELNQEPW